VFAEHYVRYLSGRIQFLSRRLDAVSADTAEGKLGQYLLTNADETDQVTISATGLSQRLGVGRATLYRAFEALERDGAIRREGKTIRILSREKL
jgi:CRP-like cAMP-binding protein